MPALPNPPPLLFSPEEYLKRERASETKHEYVKGEIFAMSGGTGNHSVIALNIGAELRTRLRGKPCKTFNSDMRVAVSDVMYAYPDVSVACGENLSSSALSDMIRNPVLLVEALSPSTTLYDRDEKFAHYRQIESFTDYLLVSQDKPHVEHHHKLAEDHWETFYASGWDASVEIPSLEIVLPLSEIYYQIEFPAPADAKEE
jgi:Uma2 family endonuclease